jgi:PIN domain nuclease of toxin-antitoxin system
LKILLDKPFLWICGEAEKLSQKARELYSDPDNDVHPLPEPPAQFLPMRRKKYGIEPLPLNEEAALHVARLPNLHSDPFDRLLVYQALVHGLTVLSRESGPGRGAETQQKFSS